MANFATMAARVTGMLIRPRATLAYNSQPVPPWGVVAREHAIPVIVAGTLVNAFLIWLFVPIIAEAGVVVPKGAMLAIGTLVRMAVQFVGLLAWAAAVGFFAGALGGRNDFNAAYLLVALAMTPSIVGSALLPIPVIGMLLWIAGFVYALVILYGAAPTLVGVPEEHRPKHLVLTIAAMVLAGIAVAMILGPLATAIFGGV